MLAGSTKIPGICLGYKLQEGSCKDRETHVIVMMDKAVINTDGPLLNKMALALIFQ